MEGIKIQNITHRITKPFYLDHFILSCSLDKKTRVYLYFAISAIIVRMFVCTQEGVLHDVLLSQANEQRTDTMLFLNIIYLHTTSMPTAICLST